MRFNPEKVAFGRHETFGLRYSWLTKGFQEMKKDPKVFESDDATVRLGVGKNMVRSIRYWLLATRITELTSCGIQSTPLGESIFGERGWDPYLEDEATIWIIHWLLITNPEMASAWYWFFCHFHKPEFTSQEVQTALLDFVKENVKSRNSSSTLKNDAALIVRMYTQSKGHTRTPLEDALDSPLSLLRLITRLPDARSYQSQPDNREGLPIGVLGFAITELFDQKAIEIIPIEELMYGKAGFPAPGSVFRLSENALITKLENLVHYFPGKYELRDTAGIHQLFRSDHVKAIEFLDKHYSAVLTEGIA